MIGRLITLAVATVSLAGAPAAAAPSRIAVGQPAPDTEIALLDGTHVTLSSLRGQVVVLNFWATWCAPCRAELPLLDAYYKLQRPHGLRVFAVTTEDSVPPARLRTLFKAMTIENARRIGGPYARVGAVPTNYVIGRDGRIRYARAAAFTLDDLNRILVPLLSEPPPADQAIVSAATPGSSLPSIHSRKAPPAVETKEKSPLTPA